MTLLFVPGSPALVPALSPTDTGAKQVRGLVADVLEELSPQAIDVVGSRDRGFFTRHTGSLKAWGVDVRVGFGNYLPELVASSLLGEAWSAKVVDSRDNIGNLDPDRLTVVVLDGSAGLHARAPLSLVDGAHDIHDACRQLLSGKMCAPWDLLASSNTVGGLAPREDVANILRAGAVVDPRLWIEAACIAHAYQADEKSGHTQPVDRRGADAGERGASESVFTCELLYDDIAHGVGRFIATWQVPVDHKKA